LCLPMNDLDQKTAASDFEFGRFLHLLWRRRLLIAAGSLLPALLAAMLLFLWPRKYTATFVYEHLVRESEYNVLVRRFYSLENLDKIVGQLREKGLPACAQGLLDCRSEGSLEKLIRLTASPAYPKRLQTTDPATSEKISAFQASLLSIQITGRSRQEVETIAAVVTGNFERVLPLYVIRNDLKETMRRLEAMAADIENNRFMLDLDLRGEQARLEKLKALEGGQTSSVWNSEIRDSNVPSEDSRAAGPGGEGGHAEMNQDRIVLQFTDVKGSREFLPLPYQVRAVQSKIVDLQETIRGSEDRYTYYVGVLELIHKLRDQIEKSILTQYAVQQFLDFVGEQLLACKDEAQADYLRAYVRRTENLVFVSTRAGENPVIYPVSKHLAGMSLLVFIASMMATTFVAVTLEYPHGQSAQDRP
jgi:hypothetical protein